MYVETMEEIVLALQDRNLAEVARRTRIPYQRVWRLANGYRIHCGYEDWRNLCMYLNEAGEEE